MSFILAMVAGDCLSVQAGKGGKLNLGDILSFFSHQGNTKGFLMEAKVWETESSGVPL